MSATRDRQPGAGVTWRHVWAEIERLQQLREVLNQAPARDTARMIEISKEITRLHEIRIRLLDEEEASRGAAGESRD
jgi:predicted RNA binding protein with dsRBD fold (UPF0201 family)